MPEESMHLLIGLGGTGANARDQLKKALEERLKSQGETDSLRFLLIDPDAEKAETNDEWGESGKVNPRKHALEVLSRAVTDMVLSGRPTPSRNLISYADYNPVNL